jgi:twitching motility protein PilT
MTHQPNEWGTPVDKPLYEIPVTGPEGFPVQATGPDGLPYTPTFAPNAFPPPAQPASFPPPAAPGAYGSPNDLPVDPGFGAPAFAAPAFTPQPFAQPDVTHEEPTFVHVPYVDPEYDDTATQTARASTDPELLAALQEVVMTSASDLHLSSNAPPMIRVDGALRPIEGSSPWSRDRVTRALMSILSAEQIAEFDRDLELDLAYTMSANARFRVNIYQQRGAIGGAFRLIPTGIRGLSDLGMPESLGRFATLARGLVLVTGPTGSGKSTTLAALIDLVNRTRADHIVTIEDPIEFLHSNQKSLVNQREVGQDTHSFANALKHVLRQDPDVILIGELRDLETISVALTAAETGHLVFATLHTQDAPQTIDRIIDVFPPHQQGQVRTQLAATLQGVVCQTLLKRANGKGRAVATEIMVTTPAIANLIREGKTHQMTSAMQAGKDLGMHTMDQHLADLVNAGTVSHEAAMEKVHDAEGFGRLIFRTTTPMTAATGSTMSANAGIDFGDAYSGR